MKPNNTTDLKFKTFKYYQQKYLKKLNEPNSLIDPLNQLCGGWSLQTFKQVINKLSTNRSAPLPLYFPSPDSMELITKSKALREQVFQAFDTRERIDASELYCALMVVSKGSYQLFLKSIVDVFGFQYQGRIQRDQFFFFLDTFFRSIPKILLTKSLPKPTEPNIRLQPGQLSAMIKTIFAQREQIERNQIYEYMLREDQLGKFVNYVQKRCTSSAEKCRNEIIQRANIEGEVRGWLMEKLVGIERELSQHREGLFLGVLG